MKKDKVKPSGLRFPVSDEAWARGVESQRATGRDIAERIERGEPFDREFAAQALRAWADGLSAKQRGKRGRPAEIDHAAAALAFESKRRKGKTVEEARAQVAEDFKADESTIDYAVQKQGAGARYWLDFIARCQLQGDKSA